MPNRASSSSRARVPISRRTDPPLPSTIGFWLARSTNRNAGSPAGPRARGRAPSPRPARPPSGAARRGPATGPSRGSARRPGAARARRWCGPRGRGGGPRGGGQEQLDQQVELGALAGRHRHDLGEVGQADGGLEGGGDLGWEAASTLLTTQILGVSTLASSPARKRSPAPTPAAASTNCRTRSTSDSVPWTRSFSRWPSRVRGLWSPGCRPARPGPQGGAARPGWPTGWSAACPRRSPASGRAGR